MHVWTPEPAPRSFAICGTNELSEHSRKSRIEEELPSLYDKSCTMFLAGPIDGRAHGRAAHEPPSVSLSSLIQPPLKLPNDMSQANYLHQDIYKTKSVPVWQKHGFSSKLGATVIAPSGPLLCLYGPCWTDPNPSGCGRSPGCAYCAP